METVEQYRAEKDDAILLNRYKREYPEYFKFIDDYQRKYYNRDITEVTMGTDYGFYYGLTNYILDKRPKHIVEYGPGFTTLLMHRIAQDLDYNLEVTSYENDPIWFDRLNEMGCNPFGTMKLATLKVEKETEDIYYCCYDHPILDHKDVDFVLIDGPGEVIIDKVHKRNINTNLHNFEVHFDKHIDRIIDGRHETQVFYRTDYESRVLIDGIPSVKGNKR